jgi:hypothetical protein
MAFWSLMGLFASWLTGWAALARRFRSQSEPYGDVRTVGPWLLAVYMRYWMHYSGIVKMTAAADALYLSIMFLFRAGHPPLRIPWSEIKFTRTKYFFCRYVVLTLGNEEKIPLRISERAARKLGLIERMAVAAGPAQPPPLQ